MRFLQNKDTMNILIIGAAGYIGEYLAQSYRALGDEVRATSRRPREGDILFDVRGSDVSCLSGLFPKDEAKHAVLCAAEASLDRCRTHREDAYDTNVTSLKKLSAFLKTEGYHVIFCSSDNVFDGIKGNYSETDEARPVNEYGKMKLEIERLIQERYPEFCIARLSKVIGRPGHKKDMLAEWKNMAAEGREIFCIRGNYFSPVCVDDVANCFRLIMEHHLSGVYHICGDRRYARAELCGDFLHRIGLEAVISEKALEDFSFSDNRPLDTSMSNDKIREATGYQFAPLEEIAPRYQAVDALIR